MYLELGSLSNPKTPRRGTKEGIKIASRSALLKHLAAFIVEQVQKCDLGIFKPSTLKNKKEILLKCLQGYLAFANIAKVGQVKVGCFDQY